MKTQLAFILASLFVLSGCSDSDNSYSPAPPTQGPQVTTVRINQVLLRALPSAITNQRFTGFDNSGLVRYGPETRDKATVIELQNVSTAVVRLQIEYLQGDTVIGLGSIPLELTPGVTVEINDPPFQDVVSALSSLQLFPAGTTIANGSSQQFSVVGTFADGTQQDLTRSAGWSSSNQSVATIGPDGIAVAASPGETTITAAIGPVTGSTNLTVSTATISSIAVAPANPVIAAGTTQDFQAVASLSDGTTQDVTTSVTWTSEETSTATIIENTGVASGVAKGQSRITATLGEKSGAAVLTVTDAILTSLAIDPPQALSAPGTKRRYRAIGTYSDNSTQDLTSQVTWSATGNAGVTISNSSVGIQQKGEATISLSAPVGTAAQISAEIGGLMPSSTLNIGRFAYVANEGSNDISVFEIEADGKLTLVETPPADGFGPSCVSVDPSGRYAYVTNNSTGDVSVFSIAPSGTLTLVETVSCGSFPASVTNDPGGRFVFVVGDNPTYSVFSVASDGTLTLVESEPIGGINPISVAVDPSGLFAYVANLFSSISVYSIANDGALTLVETELDDSDPISITVDPSGRFAYVANRSPDNVAVYSIAADGSLTLLETQYAGPSPTSVAVDPAGRFVYVLSSNVSVFSIAVDGTLTHVEDEPTGGGSQFSITVDPSGRFVYVAAYDSSQVSAYSIASDGSLTLEENEATGSRPIFVTTSP